MTSDGGARTSRLEEPSTSPPQPVSASDQLEPSLSGNRESCGCIRTSSCGRAESVDRRRVGKPRMEGHAPAVAGIPRTRTSVRLSARSMHVSSPPLDECVRACIRVRPKVHHEHTPHTHAHYASAGVHVLKLAGASCLHCPADSVGTPLLICVRACGRAGGRAGTCVHVRACVHMRARPRATDQPCACVRACMRACVRDASVCTCVHACALAQLGAVVCAHALLHQVAFLVMTAHGSTHIFQQLIAPDVLSPLATWPLGSGFWPRPLAPSPVNSL